MTRRNLNSTLPRRARGGMRDFDRLPAELRHWLHDAALPWSARSVARLWRRALHESGGDVAAARAQLTLAERRSLARDAAKIWGRPAPERDDTGARGGARG